jgi:hypothetical protein
MKVSRKALSQAAVIPAAGAVAAIAARAALPLVLKRICNRVLQSNAVVRGRVGRVSLGLWKGRVRVDDVRLAQVTGEDVGPSMKIDRVEATVQFRDLIHGRIAASVDVERPTGLIPLAAPAPQPPDPVATDAHGGAEASSPIGLAYRRAVAAFRGLPPVRLARLRIKDAAVHVQHLPGQDGLDVRAHGISAEVRNLHNNERAWPDPMAVVDVAGSLMTEGRLQARISAYPIAEQPTFQSEFRVENLSVPELNPFLITHAGAQADAGVAEVYGEVSAVNGYFSGYVKPMVEELRVSAAPSAAPGGRMKAWLAGGVAALLRNRHSHRVGTRVDFKGTLDHPQASVGAALKSALRNAFGRALPSGLDGDIGFFETGRTAAAVAEKA